MNEYKKYLVAFLDILGFKNLVNQESFDSVRKIFKSIFTDKEAGILGSRACNDEDEELIRYNESLAETRIHIMSDSIVIATPDNNPEALAVIIDLCGYIQESLLGLENPVFVRGAIAYGDFYIDDSLLFGKALVDAYMAQEYYAIYPRIILSDEICEGRVISVEDKNYKLPVDKDGYRYIDTLERYFGEYDKEAKDDNEMYWSNFNRIKMYVDKQLSTYTDKRVREKYIWLRGELERIRKKVFWNEGKLIIQSPV